MNPIAAYASTRAPINRPEHSQAPSQTSQASGDDSRDAAPRRVGQQAEFSALLALLAGTGSRVRGDLLKQLPAEGASLIDRLLNDPALAAEGDNTDAAVLNEQPATDSQDPSLAMRYGQLVRNETLDASPLSTTSPRVLSDASSGNESANGLAGIARALSNQGSNDALARVAARRGATVEQLLALGDERGADVRAALDGLLARAGTPTGEQLAAFAGADMSATAATAAAAAATAALAAANAKSAADVTTPVRDADALVPAFRSRLERVVERMKSEYGHDVELVETARSQDRQEFLFAQGRTRGGPIVTWTKESAHTRGEAADVLVDGKWNNAEGYARLQRIAREEGLRTLGVRDPGHLELPRDARQADAMMPDAAKVSARIERVAAQRQGVATASPVAGVASVAGVAGVARVAEASTPATTGATASYGAMSSTATAALASGSRDASTGNGNNERDDNSRSMNQGRKLGLTADRDVPSDSHSGLALGQTAGPASASSASHAAKAAPAAGAEAVQRASDLQDLRDTAPGSVSRLTLDVDGVDGATDRITIDLRGKTVGTHIATDAANADGLRARTGELQDALGRQGLESDSVRISSTSREQGDGTRAVSGDRDGLKLAATQQGTSGEGAAGNGQRERSTTAREWNNQDDARRARDERRNAERDAQERESQQRGGRGQQHTYNQDAR